MLLLASAVCGLFKWRQFEPEVILLAVGWYLRFSLWRAGDSRGSSCFLGLRSRAEVRIPAPEGVLPLPVEYAGSYLQEEMRSTLAPSHLLFLHHSLAHYLIDRRLDETGSDTFPA